MYELFYNFTAEPFRLSPDHRFCFEHNSYGKARAYLAYAFKRAEGFVMITGRPGTGKTTLIGELVESLATDKVVTANLVCTQLQADDLLKTVAYSFGISPAQVGKAELLQHLSTLLHSWHREGRRALLVVDEAQDLSSSAMEELRLLTNIQFGGQPLLQIFLLGQPELRDLILSRGMEQVHQRIVAASHIEGLEVDETEAYVMHRLCRVGWQGDPAIDRAIFPLIHRFSEGVPRRINLICSRLFLLGSVEERHAIEVKDVSVVIGELQAENLAAGTGISREDFKNSAKPEWVPVPDADQQATAAPHLQAASGTVSTTVEAGSVEPPVEAKKKDLPSIESIAEPVSDSIENTASATAANSPLVPEPVDFSDPAPEDDLEFHAEGNVDFVSEDSLDSLLEGDFDSLSEDIPEPVSVDELESEYKSSQAPAAGAMAVASDDFVPAAGGQAVAPVPRRRLLLMTFLMVIAIALVLLLKACFVPQDGWSFLERAPVVPDEPVPAVIASAAKAVPAKATPAKVAPVKKQELMPMVVDAGLRLLIPAATADDSLAIEPLPAADDSDGETAESPGRSLDESDAEHAVEEVVLQSWQETISIPFTFDSDELAPDSRAVLDRAAAILLENKSSKASITGFTDSQGDSKYNLLLSRKRADAVERYLVDAGIARKRLHVEGGGMLGDPAESLESELEDPMGPYRIVEIKLVGEG